jgi:small subunit ribosomal protein S12
MTRINQLIKLYRRPTKKHKIKCKDLKACPQKRVICEKLLKITPRKPNSALRRVT